MNGPQGHQTPEIVAEITSMRILFVAATLFEIRPFLSKLNPRGTGSERLHHYQMRNTAIDVLIPGIGMVQAAYHLGQQLSKVKYDLAINAGIGGSFREDLKIGEVVEVYEECITEMGAEDGDNFLTIFDLGLTDPDSPPYSNGRLVNNKRIEAPALKKLRKIRGATANTVHGNSLTIEKFRSHFDADIETMEGAAFFYSLLHENIPFAEIRAISNMVESRDKSRWNLDLALKNLNNTLADIIKELVI